MSIVRSRVQLSRHFQAWEFACHHCQVVRDIDPDLLRVLEQLRATDNKPLRVVSGYRCPVHNTAVGGARSSQHLLGKAADLVPGRFSLTQAERAGATGIGTKGQWVTHVDVREGPRQHWRYPL
jgi:uncharacterized protein YcbK (DUF882 family)